MRIQHNLTAINASNKLKSNESTVSKNIQKLSSGYRINSAADDAAGLAVSEKMRREIAGLSQAQDNTKNGINFIQTAEGGLNEITSILQRMNTLAVESANGTYQNNDRTDLQKEFTQLQTEIDNISSSTDFNGYKILDGTFATNAMTFQVGAENSASNQVSMTLGTMNASGVGVGTAVSISSQTAAQSAIASISTAVESVALYRAGLGALQNQLEHAANNLSTMNENLTSAESTIRDVDMTDEYVQFSKNQILSQAANTMLAQANAQPQNVLTLLKG